MKPKYKIEIIFETSRMACLFKGDMLNLEAYGLTMGPVIKVNEHGAPEVSANPSDYHNCVPHVKDTFIDIDGAVPIPEIDYPDGDEG